MLASGGDDKVVMIWKKSAYGGGGSLLGSKVKQVWSQQQLFLLIFPSCFSYKAIISCRLLCFKDKHTVDFEILFRK